MQSARQPPIPGSSRQRTLSATALVAAGVWCRLAAAATLDVPGDYPTIQAAIDAASNGDVVLVADGIYTGPGNRDIDFGGRLITVQSASGPVNCIIDCEYSYGHRGFLFSSGETPAAVVSGFTIRRGSANVGGGIRCEASSPTIADCIITGNHAYGTFSPGCGWGYGGGIYSTGGSPVVIGCAIVMNTAAGAPHPSGAGGGIFCGSGSLTVTNCLIGGNVAGVQLGCGGLGGGLYVTVGTVTLVNSTFSGNRSHGLGSAIYMYGGGLDMVNCALGGNDDSFGSTGGIANSYGGTLALDNCIVWGNSGTSQITGAATVRHSDVQGGWTGPGFNNIDEDPLFVDLAGADGSAGTPDDNLRLRPGSPCIDAGDVSAVPAEITTDLDGIPRRVDDPYTPDCPQAPGQCGAAPVVDMGPFEYHLPCAWDLDYSGVVDVDDFAALLAAWGTEPAGPPDFDYDGSVGIIDFLLLLIHWGPCCGPGDGTRPDCNDNGYPDDCDLESGESGDCNGNGIPDECDSDLDNNGVPDECQVVPNDLCSTAAPVGDGVFAFDTTFAATDGLSASCQGGQGFAFVNDIWFVYTPTCTGTATFSLCNAADYDSRLAVSFGTGQCPPLGGQTCSDNAPGCGQTSEVQMVVVAGFPYLVRVGGTTGGGPGLLTISCAPFLGPR